MKTKTTRRSTRNRITPTHKYRLIILAALVLFFGGLTAYGLVNKQDTPSAKPAATSPEEQAPAKRDTQSQNTDTPPADTPTTDQSTTNTPDIKTPPTQDAPTSGDKKNVKPVIISASYANNSATVRSFVPSVYETTGTCTLTLTQNASTVTKTSAAIVDASTTNCLPFVVAKNEFPTEGEWKVKISYDSPSATGSSDEQSIMVK